MLLAIDARFADVAAAMLTFGDANFLNPPATTDIIGVVELATDAEVIAGLDTTRVVTPAGLKAGLIADAVKFLRLDASINGAWQGTIDGIYRFRFNFGGSTSFASNGRIVFCAGGDLTEKTYVETNGALVAPAVYDNGQRVWSPANDGAGSGLDADLLDGLDDGYYTNIAARLGYTPYSAANPAGYLASINSTAVIGALGYTPWGPNNDGSGSGLDADLFDGQDSTSFLRLGYMGNWQATGDGAPRFYFFPGGGSYFAAPGSIVLRAGGTGTDNTRVATDGSFYAPALFDNNSRVWSPANDGAGSGLDADLLDGQDSAYFANIPARLGYTPWHPSNDGAGSGLDADLLDGRDSASFANTAHVHAAADILAAFPQLLTTNGYIALPGGFILQWGQYTSFITGEPSVGPTYFAVPFTTEVFHIGFTERNPGGSIARDLRMQWQSNDLASFIAKAQGIGGTYNLDGFSWFAIGK